MVNRTGGRARGGAGASALGSQPPRTDATQGLHLRHQLRSEGGRGRQRAALRALIELCRPRRAARGALHLGAAKVLVARALPRLRMVRYRLSTLVGARGRGEEDSSPGSLQRIGEERTLEAAKSHAHWLYRSAVPRPTGGDEARSRSDDC
jgi:hypothetical protein